MYKYFFIKKIPLIWLLAAVLALASCTDFFKTSLAPWAAQDHSGAKIKLNADNVSDLLLQTRNDTDLSLAVLRGIEDALKDANDEDNAVLWNAAMEAAVNASGICSAFLNHAEDIFNTADGIDPDEIITLIDAIINDLENLDDISGILLELIPDPDADADEFGQFIANASPEYLVMTAIILIAAEAQGGFEDYLDTRPGRQRSSNEKMAEDLIDAIDAENIDISQQPLRDMLDKMGLEL